MNALLTALMKEVCSGYHGICLRNGGVDLTWQNGILRDSCSLANLTV
jgi:hypothetical protein